MYHSPQITVIKLKILILVREHKLEGRLEQTTIVVPIDRNCAIDVTFFYSLVYLFGRIIIVVSNFFN